MSYRPDVDGLRAIAVLAVVLYHAFPGSLAGGFIGVDVFFVISGYLISGIVLDWLREDRFSLARFYARRIRRIFPALVLVLAACFGAGWLLLYADAFASLGHHMAGGAAFAANLFLWREAGYFDAASDTKPLLHLWSLGIEEQFYLVWPALLALGWRRGMAPLVVIGAAGLASFAFGVWTVRVDRVAAFYSPLTRLWELLAGAALAASGPVRLDRSTSACVGAAGLALVAASAIVIDQSRVFPGLWALMPTVGTALLLAAGSGAWVNRVVLSARPLVWLGLISYPLYLWHWPLLVFARIGMNDDPPPAVRLALVAASVALAAATERWIEHPVRRGSWQRRAVPVLSVAMTVVFAVGLLTMRADGWVERARNRSDRAHFLQYYDRLHRQGLGEAYRSECDFLDWATGDLRDAIDPACTKAGASGTWFLWGDSYAQSLSLGLRSILPEGTLLAQVTTSLCRPGLGNLDPDAPYDRCGRANRFALERVRALGPEVVILAQGGRHLETDWRALGKRLIELGAARVLVVGPFPQWRPTLPDVIVKEYWGRRYDRVGHGLDPDGAAADGALAARLAGPEPLHYVSMIEALCTEAGCLATLPDTTDLVAVDAGHLSPTGSVFVAEQVLRPHLSAAAASSSGGEAKGIRPQP